MMLVQHAVDGAVQVAEADALTAVARGGGIEVRTIIRPAVLDGFAQRRHLDGGERGFVSFITALQTGTIDGLLERLAGQNAVGVRDAGLLRGLSDAARDFSRDVLVVGGVAADDAAETEDSVVAMR